MVLPLMASPYTAGPCGSARWASVVLLIALSALTLVGCMRESGESREMITLEDTDRAPAPIPTYEYPTAHDGVGVPYVTTPEALVDLMLALAEVTAGDVVYDLGSGDGRIPIRAAQQYGARGVGIELRADLVEEARQSAEAAGVADRVAFREDDLFEADLSDATVVTIYLLPSVNLELRPKLFRELDPGTRVVSHDFHMDAWRPARTIEVGGRRLYLWRIPEETPRFVEQPG
jgi:SAM-dependent methyltransferase